MKRREEIWLNIINTKRKAKDFWEYRIYYQDPITRKTKEKSKKGFESKKEAQLAAEEMEGMIREGYEITPESLKTYLNAWLNEYKRGTVANYTSVTLKNTLFHISKTYYLKM